MVMARIFREYRNTVVNYKQFKKIIFRVTAMFLFVLYSLLVFESSSKETCFLLLWWSKLARLILAKLLIPLFKIATDEVNAKCYCLSLKSRTWKKHKNIFHHTA